MRVTEYDPRAHAHQLVDEEHARLEHLLMHEDDPLALRRGDDRDRHQVGRERGPGLILEFRDRAAEIGADAHLLLRRDEEVGAVDHGLDTEALEAEAYRAEVLDAGVGDAERRASDGGEADERTDLDVIGADPVRASFEAGAAFDGEHIRPDTGDRRAHGHEQPTEILHMRLGGGVVQDRGPARRDGRHDRVLGAGHTGLVEEDVGADESFGAERDPVSEDVLGAQRLEGQEVGIESTASDHVAPRRREGHSPGAGEERRSEQDRGADALAEFRIERVPTDRLGGDHERVRAGPLRGGPGLPHELQQALDVADARNVLERDRLVGEERGADDGQRGVLVSGGANGTGEASAAFDDELG